MKCRNGGYNRHQLDYREEADCLPGKPSHLQSPPPPQPCQDPLYTYNTTHTHGSEIASFLYILTIGCCLLFLLHIFYFTFQASFFGPPGICCVVRGLPRWCSGKESTCQCRRCKRQEFDPWAGRSPGIGNGNPLQCSCLENSMDREAWQAIVHRVTKSQTQLSN